MVQCKGRLESNRKRCAGNGTVGIRAEIRTLNVRCGQVFGISRSVPNKSRNGTGGVEVTVGRNKLVGMQELQVRQGDRGCLWSAGVPPAIAVEIGEFCVVSFRDW